MTATVPFIDAKVGDEAYTYRDDERLTDYGWVTDLEYYDDRSREIVLRRQRWLLVAEDVLTLPDPFPADEGAS